MFIFNIVNATNNYTHLNTDDSFSDGDPFEEHLVVTFVEPLFSEEWQETHTSTSLQLTEPNSDQSSTGNDKKEENEDEYSEAESIDTFEKYKQQKMADVAHAVTILTGQDKEKIIFSIFSNDGYNFDIDGNMFNDFLSRNSESFNKNVMWEITWDKIREHYWLKSLKIINFSINFFPIDINRFENLDILEITNNNFTFVPECITQIKTLRILNLAKNSINILPNNIGELNNIEYFILKENGLINLPNSFQMLEKLKVLDLSLNGFQFFPEIVTYLSSLEKLILSTVEIYSVPQTVLYLENLQILDLRDTPLVDKTNDVDNFGYIKLRENFGSRLIFSEPPSEQGSNLFEDLFKHLKPPRTTFINRKRFKQIKLPALAFPATPSFDVLLDQINIISNSLNLDDPSQPSTYVSFQSLVGYDNLNLIFGDKIEAHMDLDGATNKETFNKLLRPRLTGYIKNLYGIPLDVNESIGHQMKEENKREAQQLFSFIINKILNVPPENQISLFSQLVNGILNCATGQMEAFNTLVLALINPKEEIQNQTNLSESVTASETMEISDVNKTILFPNTFEGHLQHQITIIKNNVLQQVILEKAVNHDQNNHLIAKYRQLLSKTLGLSLIGSTFVDTVFLSNNDPFFNNKENVLNCFYEHLSPEYLCLELMKCAESKEDILSKKSSLSGFITNHKNIDERPFTAQRVGLYLLQRGLIEDETEQWKSFFDEDPFKADNTAVITYDGMMEILLHEGIIYKKTPSSSNKKPRIVESFPTTYLDLP